MLSVLNVVEPGLGFGLLRTLEQMLDRIGREQLHQWVLTLGPCGELNVGRVPVRKAPRLFSLPALHGLSLRRAIDAVRPSVVHAWGLDAGAAVAAAGSRLPWLVSLDMDHLRDRRQHRWLATLRDEAGLAIICPADTVRRRLVEAGLSMESCAIIRPGVDHAAINAAAKRFTRRDLADDGNGSLDGDGPFLLVSGRASRYDGQYNVLWAAALLGHLYRRIRVIVPGQSRESDRLRRFVRTVRLPDLIVSAPRGCTWEQLLGVCDLAVFAPDGDCGVTPVAWAMAAGVPIVATATHAITEVLADRHTAFLCRAGAPRLLADRILAMIEDTTYRSQITNEARAAAFEVFGLRRCLDQHRAAYANLLEGKPVGTGIEDSAIMT